ncbi:hypothetical protein K450DRAFT_196309 [Umbelopsis ramanniana AG]|uniref:Uncharacterized protein n=1 Tax=Umbelopsis ramanniana AG TaxID=1314678 RepID=A0AAD5HHY5_UMBRA|nr:uncharacterized protein K450DRAFT_196309 [Umbelopsis ramanniana AG]KAI8583111.1 hypothetical protein K450DRAFT_196309 [Umbelopsis ramanniana AG]
MSNYQEQYYQGPRLTFNDNALNSQDQEMIYFDDESNCYEYNEAMYEQENDMLYYEDDMYYEEEPQPEASGDSQQEDQDALLKLIVGVQQYLSDLQNAGANNHQDSPLLELQYKMYTYLKQRACEMGMDLDEALEQAM